MNMLVKERPMDMNVRCQIQKLTPKVEKAKTKAISVKKREIKEEEFKTRQVINNLGPDDESKG